MLAMICICCNGILLANILLPQPLISHKALIVIR